jgi:hypothetical protein
VRRIGRGFEVDAGAALPLACVRCGAPVVPPVGRRVFVTARDPAAAWFYWLVLGWWSLLLSSKPKSFEIAVPTCARHIARRRRLRRIGWSLVAAMTVLPLVCYQSSVEVVQEAGRLGAAALALAAAVFLGVAERTIRATEITDRSARFAGADERFLAMLD